MTNLPAERVTGIGGVFFKSKDPQALAAWYRDSLGVEVQPGGHVYAIFEWKEGDDQSQEGQTVWSIFPADTKYFGGPLMINYRVRNLDRMLEQLKAAGAEVDPKIEDDFNGRFASVTDPDGNKIQLWEPKTGA